MGFISKFKEIIAPSDYQDDVYDDEEVIEEEETETLKSGNTNPAVSAPKTVAYGSSLELKVVKPDTFDCANEIADYLLAKKTVVLNLEETNKEVARKLLDFLTGVSYAIDGTLKKVSNFTFIITPKNVNVSGEQLKEPTDNYDTEEPKLF